MSLPYFPMYPADFEADTSHLSLEEDGAYNRLLRLMWMTPGCGLPDDDVWIMRRMRCDQETYSRLVLPLISEFMVRKGGRVFSPRLREEFQKADETYRKRSDAGKRGGRPKAVENAQKEAKAGLSREKAGPKQPEPEPEPEETNVSSAPSAAVKPEVFSAFWEAYPHRNGAKKNRKGAEEKFARAVKAGARPEEIITGAVRAKGHPDVVRGFSRDPVTWLNQEGWLDQIGGPSGQARYGDIARKYGS